MIQWYVTNVFYWHFSGVLYTHEKKVKLLFLSLSALISSLRPSSPQCPPPPKIYKGPSTQNVDTWPDDWTTTYTEAKEYGIADATGTRPIRYFFLMVSRSKKPKFADAHLVSTRLNSNTPRLLETFIGLLTARTLCQKYDPKDGMLVPQNRKTSTQYLPIMLLKKAVSSLPPSLQGCGPALVLGGQIFPRCKELWQSSSTHWLPRWKWLSFCYERPLERGNWGCYCLQSWWSTHLRGRSHSGPPSHQSCCLAKDSSFKAYRSRYLDHHKAAQIFHSSSSWSRSPW